MATAKKTPTSRSAAPTPKAAAKPAASAKPVAQRAAKPAVPAAAAKPVAAPKTVQSARPAAPVTVAKNKESREDKARKPKLVRDSFTIPKPEYAVLDEIKARAAALGQPAKKSEVLRAGIKLLAGLGDDAFKAALAAVPAIKTGRPGKA